MPNDEHASQEEKGAADQDRVVPLRPRVLRPRPKASSAERSGRPRREAEIEDFEEPEDNGSHRTLANLVGLVLVVGLIATGIWLAHAIADMRRGEDCVFSGRRNCMPIEIPSAAH
jgi:hypothetical protein